MSNPISTIHVCVTVWGKSECPPNNYDQCRGYHQTIIISTVHFHQTHFNTHSLQASEPIHSTSQSKRCFYTSYKFTCSSSLSWIPACANHVTISMQMGQLWRYRSWLIIVPCCQQVQSIKKFYQVTQILCCMRPLFWVLIQVLTSIIANLEVCHTQN